MPFLLLGAAPPSPIIQSAFSIADIEAATFTSPLALRDSGPSVVRAEIILARHKFSPGEIDPVFGKNLAQTVVAYRRAHSLSLDPVIDENLWRILS